MSLPAGSDRRLCRMALLKPERIEIIHPIAPAHILIGWSLLKDECWSIGDGLDLIRTLERKADINWRTLRRYPKGVI